MLLSAPSTGLSWARALIYSWTLQHIAHSITTPAQKATIHQVAAMLATSKNVLFLGPNQLLTTNTDGPSFVGTRVIIKVSGH